MPVDIGQRAQDALFLAAPQGETDGAFGPHVQGLQDACGLHDHCAAGGVVHRSVRSDPAVQMGARHDVFAGSPAAGDVGQDVVGVDVLVMELDLAHQFQRGRRIGQGQSGQTTIVLSRQLHARQLGRRADLIGIARAVQQAAVPLGNPHPGQGALFDQEGVEPRREIGRLQLTLDRSGRILGLDIGVALGQLGAGPAFEGRLGRFGPRAGLGQHDDLARQLAPPFVEILDLGDRRHDDAAADHPVGRRRPGHRNGPQVQRPRGRHAGAGADDGPAPPELEPFGPDVRQAPVAELLLGPAFRLAHLRRIGHSPADPIRQIGGRLHHLAVVQPLVDDAVDGGPVDGLGRDRRGQKSGGGNEGEQTRHRTP